MDDDKDEIETEISPPHPTKSTHQESINKPQQVSWNDSYTKAQNALEALSTILPSIHPALSSSDHPAHSLLHDPAFAAAVSRHLRHPDSGAVDDNLCGWLYDTFHSSEPDLHLVVLRFIPVVAGVYLSRATLNKPLAGFESVLLAIYAHETAARNGQAVSVSIPDLSHSSIYHETMSTAQNGATELHLAVISPSLEPHGTVRSTRRARIVGVALELYYSKIADIPVGSKIEFCDFCKIWSGTTTTTTTTIDSSSLEVVEESESDKHSKKKSSDGQERKGRIDLPWELLQPILRILGHCLMGPDKNKDLFEAAREACKCLHERSLHDINPKSIMATRSLLKLADMAGESNDNCDHTEIKVSNVITV